MGQWHAYEAPDSNHPCTNCQAGWGSQSHRAVDGVDYYKNESCDETCERLKRWNLELVMAEGVS